MNHTTVVAERGSAGETVIGLDLALGRTGWAVVTNGPRLLAVGAFTLPERRKRKAGVEPLALWNLRRLKALKEEIEGLRRDHGFDILAYEYADRPRHPRGAASFGREYAASFGLGMAQMALLAAVECLVDLGDIEVLAIGQSEIKRTVTANKEATKAQVKTWLERRYGWDLSCFDSERQQDEVDAIAVACTAQDVRK